MNGFPQLDFIVTRQFVDGMIVMGLLTGSSFFLRFWRDTRDRLFLFFSAAFVLLALTRCVDDENSVVPYLIRLSGYVIIIVGIVDKNLRRT